MVIVICGVAGSGKTTVGQLLARELSWKFYDGDDFHPTANIDKMRRGVPLTDEDRQPWLTILRLLVEQCVAAGENAALACSALKKSYRDALRLSDEVKLVFLRGEFSLIAEQLRNRRGHFFNPQLLRSQFEDLEEPQSDEDAIVIELGRTPAELVNEIKDRLRLQTRGSNRKEEA